MMDKVTSRPNLTTLAGTKVKADRNPQAQGPKGKDDSQDSKLSEFGAAMALQAQGQSVSRIEPKALPKTETAAPQFEAKLASNRAELSEAGKGALAAKDMINAKTVGTVDKSAAFAGLKPWSRDWVFEGMIDQGSAPKPLFESKEARTDESALLKEASAEQPTTLAQLSEILKKGEAALKAQAQAQGQQVSDLSNAQQPKITRGEADGAAGLMNSLQVAVQPQSADAQAIHASLAAASKLDGSNLRATAQGLGDLDPKSEVRLARAQQAPALGAASLSGGEFLSTLSAIRGGAEQKQAGQFDQKSKDGKEGSLKESSFERKARTDESGPFKDAAALLGTQSPAQHFGAARAPMVEVTGHVTHGSMSQERLSSESLLGLTGGIKNLTPQGGGEIRVRLKPENLGELHLRVVTDGRQVGLQIQASDEHAKKILEDSIGHLKENLAVHNLSLGAVDVSVAGATSAFSGDLGRNDQRNSNLQQQQQSFSGFGGAGDFSGMSQGNQGRSGLWSGNEDRSFGSGVASARGAGLAASVSSGARPQRAASGRLDVRA